MRIVIGRGNNRQAFELGARQHSKGGDALRERQTEDVKNLVFRGGKLPFFALNGA